MKNMMMAFFLCLMASGCGKSDKTELQAPAGPDFSVQNDKEASQKVMGLVGGTWLSLCRKVDVNPDDKSDIYGDTTITFNIYDDFPTTMLETHQRYSDPDCTASSGQDATYDSMNISVLGVLKTDPNMVVLEGIAQKAKLGSFSYLKFVVKADQTRLAITFISARIYEENGDEKSVAPPTKITFFRN